MRAGVLWLAFEGLGATAALSGALDRNVASCRVSEKLGYEHNGVDVIAPHRIPVTHHRYLLPRGRWRRGVCPVSVEHLDGCLSMFGLPERSP